jgi:hypothetical protein
MITILVLRLWTCAMMFFPMNNILVLRLWTCAMMFLFSYDYYACAEAMDMCN